MDKVWLAQKVKQGLSQRQIATEAGVSQSTVKHWLRKFELTTRSSLGGRRGRTYTDVALSEACRTATSWQGVAEFLGMGAGSVPRIKARASEIELSTAHLYGNSSLHLPGEHLVELPFKGRHDPQSLGKEATACAVAWFIRRGYSVSLPVEPTAYDLITESDAGLKRVQVKSTRYQVRPGTYTAHLHRTEWRIGPKGRQGYGPRPYRSDEVDLFFILCANDDTYLIPIEVVKGKSSLNVSPAKYGHFKIG